MFYRSRLSGYAAKLYPTRKTLILLLRRQQLKNFTLKRSQETNVGKTNITSCIDRARLYFLFSKLATNHKVQIHL